MTKSEREQALPPRGDGTFDMATLLRIREAGHEMLKRLRVPPLEDTDEILGYVDVLAEILLCEAPRCLAFLADQSGYQVAKTKAASVEVVMGVPYAQPSWWLDWALEFVSASTGDLFEVVGIKWNQDLVGPKWRRRRFPFWNEKRLRKPIHWDGKNGWPPLTLHNYDGR